MPVYLSSLYLEPRGVEVCAARLTLQVGHVPRRLDHEQVERLDELRRDAGRFIIVVSVQHLAVCV